MISSRRFYVLGLSLLLAGCNILPSNPTLAVYQLPKSTVAVQQMVSSPLSLSVPEPYANKLIAHQRIAVVQDTYEVQAYPGVQWMDVVPKLYRDRLIEDLITSNIFSTVISNNEQINVDRILRLDIQSYQVQKQSSHYAVWVDIQATLVDARTGNIMKAKYFSQHHPIASSQLDDIVQGFADATNNINTSIIQWIVERK